MDHNTEHLDALRTPFLKQVAQAYTANERAQLPDYCFVVPNKRSAVFLGKYFSEALTADGTPAALLPSIVTISDFIADLSDNVELSRIEMLFILYDVYSSIVRRHMSEADLAAGKGLVDFNRFQYWGEILINDFGDVDRYLVDAAQLFRNVEGLKEISSNYLTEEQLDVIRRYWNEELVPEPVRDFWKHAVHVSQRKNKADGNREVQNKNVTGFVKLWQVMYEVYTEFRERLARDGYSYSGMTYREVAERLQEMEADDFDCDRYIFTGFSVLSKSEQSIFKSMQRMGIADFYWDYASPAMYIKGNRASRFITGYVKEFPSRYNVGLEQMPGFPDINVIAVPSTFGQAKVIAPILKRLYPQLFAAGVADKAGAGDNGGASDKSGATDNADAALEHTAIVLPDENLVSPLLNSIPREVSTVNVTMGFPLSHTSVASLIKNIVSMQLRARELRSLDTFFFEDVIALLSHPLLRARYASLCDNIVATVNKQRLFNIPVTFFYSEEYAPLRPVFSIVKNLNDSDGVIDYLDNLFNWLTQVITPDPTDLSPSPASKDLTDTKDLTDPTDPEEEEEESPDSEAFITGSPRLELQYIKAYRAALDELRRLNETYLRGGKIFLEDRTVFHLAERLLGNQSVAYEGMPLEGLQIMGVLESRGLDFENVILTSMNERIFPRKHYAKTFIPEALRRGYGMATLEHQESMYAYYFYRLIARAKNVSLLYDARTSGLRAGDMSRYISQIKYQFPQEKVRFSGSQYRLAPTKPDRMSVAKTDAIMKELERFKSSDNARYLSAHSLNTYINCPMQFYLANIERYYPENEVYDYMDQGTYGTIVHEVAEKMYLDLKGDGASLPLTPDTYAALTDKKRVEDYVARSIRRHYLCIDEDDPRPLEGDAAIFQKLMVRTIMKMYERESEFDGVEFIAGEESQYVDLKVNERHTINLNYRIDRIDRVTSPAGEEVIRLVDYKTGSDPTTTPGLDRLFVHGNSVSQPKAIFQLLLYCNAYAEHEKYDGPIQPYIYTLRKVAIKPFEPLKVAKKPLEDYRTVNEEFLSRLGELLDELYDKDTPFEAYPSDDNCKYCKFKELCSL
ncbi:MAG: hypothetical protein HDS69_10710 [Bacteroidales bacterium]|nr:hypothetical protein [Bacteroidales bacterium]